MNRAPAFGTPRHSLAFSWARDEQILWLLSIHPVPAAMLVGLGWFPTRAKALKRLRRLTAKRRVRFVGTVCRALGRPEHVFCRWEPKADNPPHAGAWRDLCF